MRLSALYSPKRIRSRQDQDAIAGLMRWKTAPQIADDVLDAALAHPRLPAAAAALAKGMLQVSEQNPALDGIFKDTGRYIAALVVVHLHMQGDLTLPKLKGYCSASGFLSPGRARALLAYLRHLQFIAPPLTSPGRGPARYAATERLTTAWSIHLRAALDAASELEPAARIVADRLADPEILALFSRFHTQELLDDVPQHPRLGDSFLHVIMHRHAGNQILWSLVAATDTAFPPSEPIALSVAATARRFGVSRIHVRRMLDDAERAGLLRFTADGSIVLEGARAHLSYLYAAQFIKLLSAAAKTVAARPDIAASP
jgi:hypothetical protein